MPRSATSAPVRILHCHSTFSLGGKEARAVKLMNSFGDAAHHVILSAMPDQLQARDAIEPGIVAEFPGDAGAPPLHGKPAPGRYVRLARYMQGFDLVLTYNWGAMDAVMAHRLLSHVMALPPLIHHEDGFNTDESDRLNGKRNLFRRIGLPTARALVVPSHTLARIARAYWGERLPLHRISNGIEVADYGPPVAGTIPGFRRNAGDFVVGTVAGLRAVKDLPLLVRALALCPPSVRLVIVGEGPEHETILAEAQRAGVADRLLLPGFLARPQDYVGHFDLLALSSQSEQQPIAVMEGMAAGLPIVAPAVGDVAEMVAPENAAFIVERGAQALANAITALAENAALARRIGAANRRTAEAEFSADTMLASYSRLYGAAMGRPHWPE